MKTPSATALRRAGYGPRPTAERRPATLSRAQRRVLVALEEQAGPATLAVLAAMTGLHPNTLRDHLDTLEQHGLVERTQAAPDGPGRPRVLFGPTALDAPAAHHEYAGLASALAATLHRTSDDPQHDAALAGDAWGRELAAARKATTPAVDAADAADAPDASAHHEVLALLDDLGFAPEAVADDASVARLTRCPLLDTARKYPDVVCGVHLGIVRGALEEYGADPAPADLLPFSEPGACRLHVATGS